MEKRVTEATKFANTPLPAPILVYKGAQLKNETLLSELALSASDYLTFLYPVRPIHTLPALHCEEHL